MNGSTFLRRFDRSSKGSRRRESDATPGPGRKELLTLWAATAAVAVAVGIFVLGREYLAFGAETDFLGGFYAEARRFLGGRPLELVFHPPLYPVVVGSLSKVLGGWVTAGLFVSWVAGIAALLCNFWFFRIAAGPAAGWGAFVAAVTSPLYVGYWAQASSELFFLALYSGAFLLAVLAVVNDDRRLWLALGLAVGVGMLTRANGLVLVLLLATPLALPRAGAAQGEAELGAEDDEEGEGELEGRRPRLRRAGLLAGGLALPLAAWVAFALATGSNLVPQGNYANLAMTYFGEGFQGATEDRRIVEAQFTGLWDVLSHDPVRMAKVYVMDLRNNLINPFEVNRLVAFPVAHLALAGLLILTFASMRLKVLYLVVTGVHVLFLNFAPYQARFYLFLVPLLGGLAGIALAMMWRRTEGHTLRRFAVGALAGGMLLAGGLPAMSRVPGSLEGDEEELRTAVREIGARVEERDLIVSRKPHLSFYLGSEWRYVPRVSSPSELGTLLSEWTSGGDTFLYYGSAERDTRPGLSVLEEPERAPGWLELIAENRDPRWVFYRVVAGGLP